MMETGGKLAVAGRKKETGRRLGWEEKNMGDSSLCLVLA